MIIEKKLRGKITLIFIIFMEIMIIYLSVSDRSFSQHHQHSVNSVGKRKLILVIIDYKDFFCPLCLEPLMAFCRALHSYGQEELALGVFIYRNQEKEGNPDRLIRIVENQLRGFITGNNIKFPVILDKCHVFEKLNSEETDIILIDHSRKLIKKYKFPLTKKQINEIFLRQ